ncbi:MULTISPECIES: hypothetical protein [Rhizobium]|uniref:Uncharacterized protein n=1 Tax=Rhizobium tropici TaxID=398 RepID=A0A329YJK2_RHITR|nr:MULTISPECIES: hypothetical protein [Rhizobium]MBX4913672.1 hypothetical protein [Rhizobium bangladeshense]RAX42514.1 hypothetical protein DQ393_06780 [Rhizobium tropici]
MAGLGDKIADKALDYVVGGVTWAVVTLIPGLLGTQTLRDPFYHAGWLQENRAWIMPFAIVLLVSTCLALRVWGLIFVTIVAFVAASSFAYFYSGSSVLSDSTQLALWVAHAVVYSLFPAMLAGWTIMALKWTGVL